MDKLFEAREKAREARANAVVPTIEMSEFIYHKEQFKRLYYDQAKNVAVFQRIGNDTKDSKCVTYEVVKGVGKDKRYPYNEQFGTNGWYYWGYPERVKERIKLKFGIELK